LGAILREFSVCSERVGKILSSPFILNSSLGDYYGRINKNGIVKVQEE